MEKEFKGWEAFDYVDWLAELIYYDGVDDEIQEHYISILHNIPFWYSIPRDANREADGLKLRETFMDEKNIPSMFYGEEVQCSVLEMLAALAVRCCDDLMGVETPGFWFWEWMHNLFKDFDREPDYIYGVVTVWLDREFDRRGYGSPFPLKKGRVNDQRNVEIWLQMCGYISENYLGLE